MIKNTREERHVESGGRGCISRLSDQRALFNQSRDLRRTERLDLGLSAGVRALQAGGTASARALRPKCASVGGVTASRQCD